MSMQAIDPYWVVVGLIVAAGILLPAAFVAGTIIFWVEDEDNES